MQSSAALLKIRLSYCGEAELHGLARRFLPGICNYLRELAAHSLNTLDQATTKVFYPIKSAGERNLVRAHL